MSEVVEYNVIIFPVHMPGYWQNMGFHSVVLHQTHAKCIHKVLVVHFRIIVSSFLGILFPQVYLLLE